MVGITNKKSLAFAALTAGASAQGWSNNWSNQQNCAGTPQPFLCEDGYGHETTSIITVYPSGCPGYTNWNTWPEAASTTAAWSNGWGEPPAATGTWEAVNPQTTAWDYWYSSNGQPICHNGHYKDGSSCDNGAGPWNGWNNGNGNGNGNGWVYGENGETTIVITLTETFVVPCSTGWQTTETVWYTTDCGCTETPYPEHPAYTTYTTECPESWGVGPTVTVTIPIATWTPPAQTWAPVAAASNTWEPASPAQTWSGYESPAAASGTWSGYGSPAAATGTWSGYGSPASATGKPVCPAYCGANNQDAWGKTCVYTEYVVEYAAYVKQCEAAGVTVYFYGKDYKLKPMAPAYCSASGWNVNGTSCSYSKYQVLYTQYVSDCTAANVTPYKWGYDTTGAPCPPPVCSAKGMDKSGKPCNYSQYQTEYVAYQAAVAAVQSWASAAVSPAAASTWASAAVSTPVAAASTWASAAVASPSAWAPVKAYTGAASSTAVSSFMLVAGLIAGAAMLL